MDEGLFGALVKANRMCGIFTVARGWQQREDAEPDRERFDAFFETKPELTRALATGLPPTLGTASPA